MRTSDAYLATLDALSKKAIELGLNDYQVAQLVSAANRKEPQNKLHRLALLDRSISDTARFMAMGFDLDENMGGLPLN